MEGIRHSSFRLIDRLIYLCSLAAAACPTLASVAKAVRALAAFVPGDDVEQSSAGMRGGVGRHQVRATRQK